MGSVQTGLEALSSTEFEALKGRSIGVLCHHASLDRNFKHVVFHLREAQPIGTLQVKCVFSPEHGLWGAKDSRIEGSNVDARAGLPVHSLYGQTYRPTREMLAGVDTLVIDLQDVGARFYTYTWSMAHCLSACEEFGVRAVVLDRPNPIGGSKVEGPVLEPALSSFVGLHPIAQRHGMTHGEIARWLKSRFYPKLDLQVVAMKGWTRDLEFESSGLPWIPPSPNMPYVDTAHVYSGICLLEGTALSEGRGTTRPFETFGHPKIDGWKLAERLNGLSLPGARFRPVYFQPTSSKHIGAGCGGCFLHVTDRQTFEPVTATLHLLAAVREIEPTALGWEEEGRRNRFDRLSGCRWLRESLQAGERVATIRERIESTSKTFLQERAEALLY